MYKIVSSRGGGRTTTLCEYAINNYVIKGVRGQFYPCDREVFEETYEEI